MERLLQMEMMVDCSLYGSPEEDKPCQFDQILMMFIYAL